MKRLCTYGCTLTLLSEDCCPSVASRSETRLTAIRGTQLGPNQGFNLFNRNSFERVLVKGSDENLNKHLGDHLLK